MKNEVYKAFSESFIDEDFLQPLHQMNFEYASEFNTDTAASPFYLSVEFDSNSLVFDLPSPEKKDYVQDFERKKKFSGDKIGTLSPLQRQAKINKYLEKKKTRTWHKKIHYTCRKKVADQRIRIKGRFVTKQQAICIQTQSGN